MPFGKVLETDLNSLSADLRGIDITLVTVIIVLANKEMFFETDHVGKLPEYKHKYVILKDK